MIFSASLDSIPGIVHGFGTAAELVPRALQPHWDQRPDKRQVHGVRLAHVTAPHQRVGEADAFHTAQARIPVSVITADCVPLLLARRDGRRVAAVHAGWRGLHDGIIPHVLAQLEAGRGDWVAAIGPTICAACYEVSAALALQFAEAFPAHADTVVPSHRHLDLRALARHQLARGGVTDVDDVGGCTCCTRGGDGQYLYRSYRRGDRNSQQHAGLLISPDKGPHEAHVENDRRGRRAAE